MKRMFEDRTMDELTVKEFLKIKQKICLTKKHCIKCEFYYGCNQIANATEKEMDAVIEIATRHKKEVV